MIPVKHIDPDDLALYAMQLLPPDEMEEMSLHLQYSAEARRVLSEYLGDLALFAYSADMHTPPALTRQRLMKHVAREKKVIPPDPYAQPVAAVEPGAYTPRQPISIMDAPVKRSLPARVLPWVGWAIAAGLTVMVATQHQDNEHLRTVAMQDRTALTEASQGAVISQTAIDTVKDPAAVHVVLTSTGIQPPPEGRASYLADKGALVFVASNLAPLQPYKTYELWVIPSTGDPIAAGTFKPDDRGNASVVLPKLPSGIYARTFGVTVEDGDGSTSPTLPIILKGTAS